MEDFLRACHDAVKDGEAKKLAAAMGLPHVSLLQRANPDNDAHRLTINHLFQILLHSGDTRPLQALADAFGFELVKRDRPEPKPLLAALAHLGAEAGDVSRFIYDAAADNHLSQHEKAQGDKSIQEAIDALLVLRESLKAA